MPVSKSTSYRKMSACVGRLAVARNVSPKSLRVVKQTSDCNLIRNNRLEMKEISDMPLLVKTPDVFAHKQFFDVEHIDEIETPCFATPPVLARLVKACSSVLGKRQRENSLSEDEALLCPPPLRKMKTPMLASKTTLQFSLTL